MKATRVPVRSLKTVKSAVWKSEKHVRLASHSIIRDLTSRVSEENTEESGKQDSFSESKSHIPKNKQKKEMQPHTWHAKKYPMEDRGTNRKMNTVPKHDRWIPESEQTFIPDKKETMPVRRETISNKKETTVPFNDSMSSTYSPMKIVKSHQNTGRDTAERPESFMGNRRESTAVRKNIPAGWGSTKVRQFPGRPMGTIPPAWEMGSHETAFSYGNTGSPQKTSASSHDMFWKSHKLSRAGPEVMDAGRGMTLSSRGTTIASQGITLTSQGVARTAGRTASTSGLVFGTMTAGATMAIAMASNASEIATGVVTRGQEKIQEAITATMEKKRTNRENQHPTDGTGLLAFSGMAAMFLFFPMCILLMVFSSTDTSGSAISRHPANAGTILEVAREEVLGVHRGGTKYKTWYGMDDNWCAMFVSWCAEQCGYLEQGIMPKTASVSSMQSWYIEKNLYRTKESGYEPVPGDIIIFKNGRSHVGIVSAYDAATKTITTIEGNTGSSGEVPYHSGSQVKERTYSLSEHSISGYGTPLYPMTVGQDTPETEPPVDGMDENIRETDHNMENNNETIPETDETMEEEDESAD